jgi:hypothetical protein
VPALEVVQREQRVLAISFARFAGDPGVNVPAADKADQLVVPDSPQFPRDLVAFFQADHDRALEPPRLPVRARPGAVDHLESAGLEPSEEIAARLVAAEDSVAALELGVDRSQGGGAKPDRGARCRISAKLGQLEAVRSLEPLGQLPIEQPGASAALVIVPLSARVMAAPKQREDDGLQSRRPPCPRRGEKN